MTGLQSKLLHKQTTKSPIENTSPAHTPKVQ